MLKEKKFIFDDYAKKKYIASPYSCPKCGSQNITGKDWNADYNQAWREVECELCDYKWVDIYTLTDAEEV